MKVAFYYPNAGIKDVDCRNIEQGNPGIGGTHFAMLQIASLLSDNNNDIDVFLFAQYTEKLPSNLNILKTEYFQDVIDSIINIEIDIIILSKIGARSLTNEMLMNLSRCNVKVIVWGHCFMTNSFLTTLTKYDNVKCLVTVSKQQLFHLCDHKIFKKSTYIYNICNFKNPYDLRPYKSRKNNVVFVGAINPIKGVHLITNAWNKVLKKFPDAQLYIIGGQLYSKNKKMGAFNITDEFYEKKCLKPILRNNQIDKSVHFMGIMGSEKWEILNNCKVGIVNAAQWETFGYTMVEMQLAGLKIASLKSPGLIDTMFPGNGILYNSKNELANSIIELLSTKEHDPYQGIEYIENKFSITNILNKWIVLLNKVYDGSDFKSEEISSDLKFIKLQIFNMKIKRYLKFLPSLILYRDIYLNCTRIKNALLNPGKIIHKLKTYTK